MSLARLARLPCAAASSSAAGSRMMPVRCLSSAAGTGTGGGGAPYSLPPLPYDYGALEPAISGQIMETHHKKHHQAYVNNLNAAVAQLDEARHKQDPPTKLVQLQSAINFNGGGHINHSIFWTNLAPKQQGGGNNSTTTTKQHNTQHGTAQAPRPARGRWMAVALPRSMLYFVSFLPTSLRSRTDSGHPCVVSCRVVLCCCAVSRLSPHWQSAAGDRGRLRQRAGCAVSADGRQSGRAGQRVGLAGV